MARDAFRSMRHAFELLEREPAASQTAAHVFGVLAFFADGYDGTNIRPTNERVAAITGRSVRVVERAIAELLDLGELIRVNGSAHRGSAACYRLNFDKKARRPRRALGVEKARRPRRQSPPPTSAHHSDQGHATPAKAGSAHPPKDRRAEMLEAIRASEPAEIQALLSADKVHAALDRHGMSEADRAAVLAAAEERAALAPDVLEAIGQAFGAHT
jgi:hypothetical protein